MNKSIMFFTAICAAVSVGSFSFLLLRHLSEVKLDKGRKTEKKIPLLFKLSLPFIPLVRAFAEKKIFASWRKIDGNKLLMAGYGEQFSDTDFMSLRILFAIDALFFLLLGAMGSNLPICILLAVLFILFPALWLNGTIKKRHESIMRALPNVLDLLTLSVESGRDLLSALRDILARRKMDPLGEELTHAFQQIQLGKPRTEALRELSLRVRQVDLTATINAIIQAEEFGVSIGHLLRIQGDMQRNKRFALAEKLANESSVKIIIPVVLCILPAVFIILMGPLATQAMSMFK